MNDTRVTLKQIAEAAGVSVMTASNALNGVEKGIRVDALKRADHVRRIAEKLGYRPNGAAKAMVTGRFGAVGLLSSTVASHSVIALSLPAMQAACRNYNLLLSLGELPDEQLDSAQELPKVLREWSVDGLLVNYAYDFPPAMREHIRRTGIPAVWVNVKHNHNCVHPDDEGAGFRGTELLLQAGHRRIAYVTFGHSGHYSHDDRAAGYTRAMAQAGLAPQFHRPDHYMEADEIGQSALALLRDEDRPTAIITYSGSDAVSLAWHARELGLSVPRDLSLVVIDHSPPKLGSVRFTTLVVPFPEVGAQSVEMLRRKMSKDSGRKWAPPLAVPFRLDIGQTISYPPDTSGR